MGNGFRIQTDAPINLVALTQNSLECCASTLSSCLPIDDSMRAHSVNSFWGAQHSFRGVTPTPTGSLRATVMPHSPSDVHLLPDDLVRVPVGLLRALSAISCSCWPCSMRAGHHLARARQPFPPYLGTEPLIRRCAYLESSSSMRYVILEGRAFHTWRILIGLKSLSSSSTVPL